MEKEFNNLSVSVAKALNESETPLKMKHARNVIIATHRMKEVKSLWVLLTRQALMEHRFTAWKFCHILHKVLREGHEIALQQSLTHKKLILEVGKLWGHLQDDVGPCIKSYTTLLVQKLDFHYKYPLFPGTIAIDFIKIIKFASGDEANSFFQLCVEIFDYLDGIIQLQDNIFTSVNTFRMSSMTPQGQCRLAPLITLIEDANPLYDISVRLMFKLHDNVSKDVLYGHRERFITVFNKLKHFYDNVRPLQYFADVVQLPSLPDMAPNFLLPVDFRNYVAPLMLIQTTETNMSESNTEIVSDNNSTMDTNLMDTTSSYNESQEQNSIIEQKDSEIKRLQEEIKEKDELLQAHESLLQKLEELYLENSTLGQQIHEVNGKLGATLHEKSQLEIQMQHDLMQAKGESKEWEEKTQVYEDKFQKLKIMYAKLRDEHVTLLRLNGEDKKLLQFEKQHTNALKLELDELCGKVKYIENDSQQFRDQFDALLNEKADTINKLQANINEQTERMEKIQQETNDIRIKYQNEVMDKERNIQMYEQRIKCEEEKYLLLKNELEDCQHTLQEKEEILYSLMHDHDEVQERLAACKSALQHLDNGISEARDELKDSQLKMTECEGQVLCLTNSIRRIYETLNSVIIVSLKDTTFTPEQLVEDIHIVLQLLDKTCEFCKALTHKLEIAKKGEPLPFDIVNNLHFQIIHLTLYFVFYHYRVIFISNGITELLKAEEYLEKHNDTRKSVFDLYDVLTTFDKEYITDHKKVYEICKNKLIPQFLEIKEFLIKIQSTYNSEQLNLGDMLQQELKLMDQIIEEATQKIKDVYAGSMGKTSGLKLKLNEKILGTCTNLMEAIKVLIMKSRNLQEEIVSQGKGGFPSKEFYKRNSQWTEGLISAAKNIANAAKYLVDSANKFFNSESSNNFEIIVAAQDIAATTVQLVIASKVKADKDSQRLSDLTSASRVVSEATGAIVAAVEDRNQQLQVADHIDISELNSSKRKAKEMEIHVRVLELETALQNERYKLSSYRKACYKDDQGH